MPCAEPIYGTMCLYNKEKREKLSEDFHFRFLPSEFQDVRGSIIVWIMILGSSRDLAESVDYIGWDSQGIDLLLDECNIKAIVCISWILIHAGVWWRSKKCGVFIGIRLTSHLSANSAWETCDWRRRGDTLCLYSQRACEFLNPLNIIKLFAYS
jgi:hypothetical protein